MAESASPPFRGIRSVLGEASRRGHRRAGDGRAGGDRRLARRYGAITTTSLSSTSSRHDGRAPILLSHGCLPLERTPDEHAGARRFGLAQRPNVACKISTVVGASQPEPRIELAPVDPVVVEAFGADRCMLASIFSDRPPVRLVRPVGRLVPRVGRRTVGDRAPGRSSPGRRRGCTSSSSSSRLTRSRASRVERAGSRRDAVAGPTCASKAAAGSRSRTARRCWSTPAPRRWSWSRLTVTRSPSSGGARQRGWRRRRAVRLPARRQGHASSTARPRRHCSTALTCWSATACPTRGKSCTLAIRS